MRGKVNLGPQLMAGHRITPAYAGKRAGASLRRKATQDHPRVCGEKPGTQRPAVGHIGSPPRMRGKVKKPTMNRKKRRITPAYAGKSQKAHDEQEET